jgi:hypothetical protein
MVPRSPSSASPAFWGKSRAGKNVVRQVTAKNRYARALEAVTDWCRRNRHQPIPDQSAIEIEENLALASLGSGIL